MMTREDAIEWLNQAGLNARPHDGWLGTAIAVSRMPRAADDFQVLDNNVFIHPVDDGSWRVTRFRHGGREDGQSYATLAAAASAARCLVEGPGEGPAPIP
jgi:hypothetical protein